MDGDEGAFAQYGFNQLAFFRGTTLQGMDDRHGHLPLAQVAGYGLAENFFGGGEVQDIIHDLEGHAQAASEFPDALLLFFGCPRQDRAHSHARGKQAGGLAVDKIEVLVQGDAFAQLFNLEQLAFHHLLGEVDENVEDAEVALLHGDLEGLHVKPVAGEHAHGVSPLRVGRRTPATGLGFVDNIVVNQGGGVDDLHYRAQLDGAATGISEELGREQQQRRTDALAAASAQILANFSDGADTRDRVASELALDGGKVFPQQVKNLFPRNGCGAAQFFYRLSWTCSW